MAQPARTHSFASLLGLGKKPAAAADPLAARVDGDKSDDDSDERKKKDGESDEDYAKRMDALDAKKAKAESDKDKSKDDDGEKAKAAATTERARCAAIVAHGINCGAVRQACVYAFDTNLSVDEAKRSVDAAVLDRESAAPAPAPSPSLAARMAREAAPVVHDDGGGEQPAAGSVKATIAAATAAMAKAMGKSPTA